MCMINDTEKSERELFIAYTIENIINGLKYIGNELDPENTPTWNSVRRQLENIDNQVDRLVNRTKWK